jgi:hypothetical protein
MAILLSLASPPAGRAALLSDPLPSNYIVGLAAEDQSVVAEFDLANEIAHVARIDISRAAVRDRCGLLIDEISAEIGAVAFQRGLCLLRRRFSKRELWPLPIGLNLHRHNAGRIIVDIYPVG